MKVRLDTNNGSIDLELDTQRAPVTSDNFLSYVDTGHYDGTVFHRVIKGFMIQGGGFDTGMVQRPTQAPIQNEADNGLSNVLGAVAMARTSDPHSASSQFFINTNDNNFLDHKSPSGEGWGYCVFAHVVAGMDIVHQIESQDTGNRGMHGDVPVDDIVIERAHRLDV